MDFAKCTERVRERPVHVYVTETQNSDETSSDREQHGCLLLGMEGKKVSGGDCTTFRSLSIEMGNRFSREECHMYFRKSTIEKRIQGSQSWKN